jgi:hypothetical protein
MELLFAAGIWWILVLVYALILLLLPFFILRIRREVIEIARDHRRILALLEAVIPQEKKPKPRSEPKVVFTGSRTVRVCPGCEHQNEMQDSKCAKCGGKLLP